MNIGTAVVLLILCGVVALIIRKMAQDKRNGKSLQCGMDCQHCGGHCAHKAEERSGRITGRTARENKTGK